MKHTTKLTAGALALGLVAAAALSDPDRKTVVLAEDGSGWLTGVEVEDPPANAIPLAKIVSRDVNPKGYMGEGTDPVRAVVEVWTATLPDGRTLRLQPVGAMPMLPGETIEEARERFARTHGQ